MNKILVIGGAASSGAHRRPPVGQASGSPSDPPPGARGPPDPAAHGRGRRKRRRQRGRARLAAARPRCRHQPRRILQGSRGTPYGREFARAHVELPKRIIAGCARHGIHRYLHMSALGADPKGPSMYSAARATARQRCALQRSTGPSSSPRDLRTGGPVPEHLRDACEGVPGAADRGADVRFQPVWIATLPGLRQRARQPRHVSQELRTGRPAGLHAARTRAVRRGRLGPSTAVLALPGSIAQLQARMMELAPASR